MGYSVLGYNIVVVFYVESQDELYEMDYEMMFTGDWNMRGGSPAPPAQGRV